MIYELKIKLHQSKPLPSLGVSCLKVETNMHTGDAEYFFEFDSRRERQMVVTKLQELGIMSYVTSERYSIREIEDMISEGGHGLCIDCGQEAEFFCDPDTRAATCTSCGEDSVYGIEELVQMGELI